MVYEQISANKHKTWFLIFLFTIILIILGWVFGLWIGDGGFGITLAILFTVFMTLMGYYHGDKLALASSGAKHVEKMQSPELYRVIENLAITAGLPTPKIYLIQDEAINAFATGRDPNHASIAVTSGALKALEKNELEGVIAHELSHVGNYDIRVMTLVVVLVGVILLLSDWMKQSIFFRPRQNNDDDSRGGNLILFLAFAILSPIFAQLIKLAVSRQREYLADACGCLLTRYPEGLISALEKISAQDQPMSKANHATAHMFLANPFDPHVTAKFEQLFSTHPPIEERIRRLKEAGL